MGETAFSHIHQEFLAERLPQSGAASSFDPTLELDIGDSPAHFRRDTDPYARWCDRESP
jgi:hypothetical protein